MKYPISKLAWILVLSLLLGGCDPEISSPVGDVDDLDAGSADPADFIVVGDSLSAGYADGALYRLGQTNSYPNILAGQLQLVGGGVFTQPLMPAGATGSMTLAANSLAPNVRDRLVLVRNEDYDPDVPGSREYNPEIISPTQSTEIGVPLNGPFHNLGVPGAKSYHLPAANYGDPDGVLGGTANPFFVRFASSVTTSVLADAAAQAPSLFVVWIGNNDVLLYALEGGTGVDRTGNTNPLSYSTGVNDITDPGVVAGSISAVLATLKTANNKAVIGNVPQISAIPYFTTVPYAALPLTDQASVDGLNAAFADYNDGLTAAVGASAISEDEAIQRMISFQLGANALLIEDEDLTDLSDPPFEMPSIRQATDADFILLPTASKIGTDAGGGRSYGASAGLEDGDVLTESEAAAVETARLAYNAAIASFVTDEILLFDAAALLDELNDGGIDYGTGVITSTFASGGGFSLDGIHPTQRGYAVIANGIIEVMNTGFGATISPVDPGLYPTVFIQ